VNALTIAQREVRAMFSSAVGWLVLTGFLAVAGLFWTLSLAAYVEYSQQAVVTPYLAAQLDMTEHLISQYFGSIGILFVFICPALSMRLFAPEVANRTLELLLTSPVSTAEIVLGKFLGALAFTGTMLLATLPFPLMLFRWGNPDLGAFVAGYLGTLLLAGALLSMGMLASAFTRSQIVAFMLAIAGALVLWVLQAMGADGWQAELAIVPHTQDMWRGVIRLSDLTYFAAFIGFFLFATHQRLEAHRWS
jgi:ABC-2 type transport system permease protein